ncbi:MAG: Uncharacterized protein G01um10145_126 [Microgenomates group bacterium Gr01-1014_5]|nr:MAG: Uncharacterized protein G01um10145_126 [Microgenomates group bacterium Gr01-1014_5]
MFSFLKILFFIYLVLFPFGQVGRIEFNPEVRLHLADAVVGIIALTGIYGWWRKKLKTPPYAREFVMFLVVALFSLVINFPSVSLLQFLSGSLYFIRLSSYFLFYLALWNLFRDGSWQVKVPGLLLTVGFFVVLFGFVQYVFFPDLGFLSEFGWDPHTFRLAGTFLDTGFAGILIVLFTVILFSRIWGRVEGKFPLFPFGLVALALTYSRASYLAYFTASLVFYIVRRKLLWFTGVVLALAVLIPLLPKSEGESVNLVRTSTITYRVNNYKRALEVIGENPVFGVGYNLYRYTQNDQQSHGASGADSSLLLVLATTGIAGFLVFLQLALKITQDAWLKRKTHTGIALLASVGAVGVHSFFDNSLFYPWVLGWLLILLASQD